MRITAPGRPSVAFLDHPNAPEVLMMRPRAMLAFAAVVLALPATLPAQGDIRLGLGGGISWPVRAYSDVVDKGWVGAASLTFFPAAAASLGIRLDGIYAHSGLSVASGKQTELGGIANLAFQFGSRRSPNRLYVFGGGGYMRTRTNGPSFGTITSTDPAFNVGAGFLFGVKALALFVEARYLTVSTSGTKPQFAPVTGGISIGGL
jgi:hypothetical protein